MPLPFEEFLRLGVALLVGFLIGLDRERAEARKQVDLFAGIRTFPLIALAGAVPSLAAEAWGIAPLIATLAAFAALLGVAYFRSTAAGNIGATTEVAALVTFLLGALAGRGELVLAAGIGIAVALLLNAKPRLERFSHTLSQADIDSALELGVISCIVLPLLPNEGMGPWRAWNPFEIWLVVVAVSALSFAGFVAMRWLGSARGLLLSGAIGALVSSTAVTAVSIVSRGASRVWRGAGSPRASTCRTKVRLLLPGTRYPSCRTSVRTRLMYFVRLPTSASRTATSARRSRAPAELRCAARYAPSAQASHSARASRRSVLILRLRVAYIGAKFGSAAIARRTTCSTR